MNLLRDRRIAALLGAEVVSSLGIGTFIATALAERSSLRSVPSGVEV